MFDAPASVFDSEFSPEQRRLRRAVYLAVIAAAAGIGLAAIVRVEPLLSANDRSRWATVRALVHDGTYRIDGVIAPPGPGGRSWDTIDKVRDFPVLLRDDFDAAFFSRAGWQTAVPDEALAGGIVQLTADVLRGDDAVPVELRLSRELPVRSGDFAVEVAWRDFITSGNASFSLVLAGDGARATLERRSFPGEELLAWNVLGPAVLNPSPETTLDAADGVFKLEYNADRQEFRAYWKASAAGDYLELPGGPLAAAPIGDSPVVSLALTNRSPDERAHVKLDWFRVIGPYRFYSSKPPLLSTLVAGVYAAVRLVTGWELTEESEVNRAARVVLVIVNLLPWLAALAVLAMIAERYVETGSARVLLMASAAFGTFLSTFLVTLNNHTVAAIAVVFALSPALRILVERSRRPLHFALAGFFAAFAAASELPAAAFGAALFGMLAWRSPLRALVCFVPAALVPLAAHFGTNYLATGGWKPFYAFYGTELYRYLHEGRPSYWMDPKGLDVGVDSAVEYFANCTIGHHGILSLSPIFVLTVAAWLTIFRWRRSPLWPVQWLGLGLTVLVLGFYLSRPENYNYGGNTAGLRWTFWLIPLWLVSMLPAVDEWSERPRFGWLVAALLAVSCFSAFYAIGNPWQHPWLYVLFAGDG
ncbi:MAG TPA: hypothetical protein VML55_16010 [Planctomycetaceae bacterium]|nr:hypothetical protein [Planctomycetaceae bacterium]